ncbi:hypothetical protein [Alkalihalobacillus sp. 1P02AB]|uniref:hypothetical protein n=1 Tax=Alkalihalobacillus sp. 1P02AB TaxID=3132260 RepID=UPI0039A46C38
MNIDQALRKIKEDKSRYFKYKHDLFFKDEDKPANDEEFLVATRAKTLNTFRRWERTPEYAALYALYLEAQYPSDLSKAYQRMAEGNADKESIDVMSKLLKLKEDIKRNADEARKELGFGKSKGTKKTDELDDLDTSK